MFVTWFQCVVAVVACYVLGNFREASPAMNMFPTYKYDWAVAKQVRNSVFLWLMRVWEGDAAQHCLCGNDCFQQPLPEERRRCFLQCWSITDDHLQCGMRYRHLNLLMLWTPQALSYMILGNTTSFRAMAMCSVIIAGFFLGVDQVRPQQTKTSGTDNDTLTHLIAGRLWW